MYAGAAGIGTFFLDMHRATGDSSYLTYSEGAATWLIAMANKSHGYTWVEKESGDNSTQLSTRWTFGSPGIGGFFINLYLATGNSVYANVANMTAEGLIYYADASEGGYSWTRYNSNTERFVGRWHGAAGIGTFFIEMYDLFGNATHLEYAEGIADWIYATHEEDQGHYYPDNNATVSKSYKLGGWSRSPAGIGGYFGRLYETTSNSTYLVDATQVMEFLKNNSTALNGGLAWKDASDNDRVATAIGHGIAGTGLFMLQGYQLNHDYSYRQVIEGIVTALRNLAYAEAQGSSWTQSDKTSDVHFGLYYGVAGVGYFLLKAASAYPIVDFDSPTVSSPGDINVDVGDTVSIDWTVDDVYPGGWAVSVDSSQIQSSAQFDSGDTVSMPVDTASAGTFEYAINVTDFFGRSSIDIVTVTVSAATTTTTTTTTTGPTTTPPPTGEIPYEFQIALWSSILLNVALVAVLVIVFRTRR